MCGHPYKIHDIDRSPILKLLAYLLQDKAIAEDDGLDFRKGVLVTGPFGCGKSSIVKILRTITGRPQHLRFYTCRNVDLDYALKGHEVILAHLLGNYMPPSARMNFSDSETQPKTPPCIFVLCMAAA